jgi:hypothetical protein
MKMGLTIAPLVGRQDVRGRLIHSADPIISDVMKSVTVIMQGVDPIGCGRSGAVEFDVRQVIVHRAVVREAESTHIGEGGAAHAEFGCLLLYA